MNSSCSQVVRDYISLGGGNLDLQRIRGTRSVDDRRGAGAGQTGCGIKHALINFDLSIFLIHKNLKVFDFYPAFLLVHNL